MLTKKTILLMDNSSVTFRIIKDIFNKRHSVVKINVSSDELSDSSNTLVPDLIIANFNNIPEKEIVSICEMLNVAPFENVPFIYTCNKTNNELCTSIFTPDKDVRYVSSVLMRDFQECITDALRPKSSNKDSNFKKKHILIIDDDIRQITTLANYLYDDYEISSAVSATRAFMEIGNKVPDLILLDYMMPVCDGKQTLMMIRSQSETKDVPVIILTSHTEKDRVLDCLNLGISAYLVKPVVKPTLLTTIASALNKQ